MKRRSTNHRFAKYGILLGIVALTAGCGNLVFMDGDGFLALREAKNSFKAISVEGKVTDAAGTPLEGISVIVIGRYLKDTEIYYGRNYQEIDTLFTDSNGLYRMAERTVTPAFTDLQLDAFDSSGRYANASVVVQNIQVGSIAPTITLKKKPE